jgi:hypothetical protein
MHFGCKNSAFIAAGFPFDDFVLTPHLSCPSFIRFSSLSSAVTGVLKTSLDGTTIAKVNVVRFEVFTAATMKNGVFWDVTPCGSCKN